MYAWIVSMKGRWPITLMCEVLEVSPSGYFSWGAAARRPATRPRRSHSDEALLAHIRAIHEQLRGEYGWPRMHKELLARGLLWATGGQEKLTLTAIGEIELSACCKDVTALITFNRWQTGTNAGQKTKSQQGLTC
jgi:hypothetical protein